MDDIATFQLAFPGEPTPDDLSRVCLLGHAQGNVPASASVKLKTKFVLLFKVERKIAQS